jgi:hypothetical protein
MDPAAENSQPTMLIPPNTANEAGSMKIPEPIMLPVTIDVAVQNPSAFFGFFHFYGRISMARWK